MKCLILLLIALASQTAVAESFTIELSTGSMPVAVHTPSTQLASKPAVVYMSGCDISDGAKTVIKNLVERGVVVAVPRPNVTNLCTGEMPTTEQRAEEAYKARDELIKRGLANAENIGLLGFSHGARAVSHAMFLDSKPFAAAVSFYGLCPVAQALKTPTLMLVSKKDTWAPPDTCESLKASLNGQPFELKMYETASHSWDNDKPFRQRKAPNGQMIGMWYDAEVTKDSIRMAVEFFEKHLTIK